MVSSIEQKNLKKYRSWKMKNKIYNQLSEKYVDVEGKRIARVPSNINYIKENHHPTYNFIKSLEDNKNDIQDYYNEK